VLTDADIKEIIAQYDVEVRANTSPSYDALRAVATCEDDDIMWEVIEVAERMGYLSGSGSSGTTDVHALQDAADAYQAKLRAELGIGGTDSTLGIGGVR
jgi:hypothetical protein